MGTDRYELTRGPCPCGGGELVVVECEPDHPFAKASQRWWDTSITCEACKKTHSLIKQGDHIVLVRSTHVTDREALRQQWHAELADLRQRPDVQAVLKELVRLLGACTTKAAAYRMLRDAGFLLPSQSTFTRKWVDGETWVKTEVTIPSRVESALRAVGRTDPDILKRLRQINELGEQSQRPLPAIGEPVVRVTHCEGFVNLSEIHGETRDP